MDKKQRTQIIIMTSLILILIFAWVNAIKTIRDRSKDTSSSQPSAPSGNVLETQLTGVERQAAISVQKGTEDTYDTYEWERCPFCGLLLNDEANMVDLQLNGIIWDESKPHVLINNEPYALGDQVENYTIVEIFKHKVVLRDGEKEFELLLL